MLLSGNQEKADQAGRERRLSGPTMIGERAGIQPRHILRQQNLWCADGRHHQEGHFMADLVHAVVGPQPPPKA